MFPFGVCQKDAARKRSLRGRSVREPLPGACHLPWAPRDGAQGLCSWVQATAPETGSAGRLGDRQTDGRTARRAPSRPAGTCGSRTGRTASAGRAGWTSPSHRRSRQLDPPRKEKRGASGSGACVTAPATPRPACWCVCGGEGGAAEAVGVAARAALAVTPVARGRPRTALVARGVQELLLSLGDTRGLGGQEVECGVGGPSGCASAASSPRAPPSRQLCRGWT